MTNKKNNHAKIALCFALAFSSAAFADVQPRSAYEVCSSIYSDSQKVECAASIGSHYFDKYAAGVCYNIYSDATKAQCVRAISDKEYGLENAKLCDDLYSDTTKLDCLNRTGRSPQDPRCPSLAAIQITIQDAVSEIDRNRAYRAEDMLRQLDLRLSDCRRP